MPERFKGIGYRPEGDGLWEAPTRTLLYAGGFTSQISKRKINVHDAARERRYRSLADFNRSGADPAVGRPQFATHPPRLKKLA